MRRRLFLRNLYLQGIALPSAYLLAPTIATADDAATADAPTGRGCGRDSAGAEKRSHGFIVRDFHDPYLELIRLLKEASEIEHALMIQYLYAAFSLKPQYQGLVGPPVPNSDGLMGVAIQEMQHLAIVNKLLVALGSSPNLRRQDLPYEPDIYPFPMTLEPLSRTSLARYTYAEAGSGSIIAQREISEEDQLFCDELTGVLGSETGMNHVAGLYGIIVAHVKAMVDADQLRIDDPDEWIEQLEFIMHQGEIDHFNFFRKLFQGDHDGFGGNGDPWRLAPTDVNYPSFQLPIDPSAYLGHANQMTSPEARELGWLSNLHYWIVLMLLDYYYRSGEEGANALAQIHMVGPLQSLASRLADLGAGVPFDSLSLGYSPSIRDEENLLFLEHLSREAASVALALRKSLPATYPLAIETATHEFIRLQLEARS